VVVALLNRAALEYLRGAPGRGERAPDVIHIHDWHTGPSVLLRGTALR